MKAFATSIAALMTAGAVMAAPASADPAPSEPVSAATTPSRTIRGTFDVELSSQPPRTDEVEAQLARMLIRKQFHGDLEASSQGQMLSFRSARPGSAGYVAMERVEGRLAGRRGSFVLMHMGEMARGAPKLSVRVVPDSGTGELVGLSGDLSIEIRDGKHVYEFSYRMLGE